MPRVCGECILCCSLLEVKALDKPINTACIHCSDTGCAIYGQPERPIACSSYQCAWLFNDSWSEALRPDRCGVVFEPFGNLNFTANVDPVRPDAWRTGPASVAISKMIEYGCAVIVVIGETKHIFTPDGKTHAEVWDEFSDALKEVVSYDNGSVWQ